MPIDVIEFSDPGCPWAYSANPDLTALRWRYGSGLTWRFVTIGLAEDRSQYEQRGYTPAEGAKNQRAFARFGMPFSHEPKSHFAATARMCRAVVATRLQAPERERAVFRALAFAQFTTPLVMDEDASVAAALARVDGLDAGAIIHALDSAEVTAAYEAGRAEARSAAGGATEFQNKHATTDGPSRYTAPSLIFTASDGRSLEAGGFQSLQVYDVCIANLDRTLERRPPAEDPIDVLREFPDGLVTAELVAATTSDLGVRDPRAVEERLIDHIAAGRVRREALGDDALWHFIGD